MRYESERELVLNTVKDMARWGMLDTNGGAVSVRADSGDILITVTGAAFTRWQIGPRDIIVLTPDGDIVERTGALAASGTWVHLAIYRAFGGCGGIVHAHSPYSLAFASLGMSVPSVINQLDTLGEVPCLAADDSAIKADVAAGRYTVDIPSGISQRADVAAVNVHHLIPQLYATLGQRADELTRHGLAFLLYRHGAFAFARGVYEAVDNLARVEASARTALYQAILCGGLTGIRTNALFGVATA